MSVVLALALLLPIHAHSPSELNTWLEDWTERHERATHIAHLLSREDRPLARAYLADLEVEYDDMRERHPHWDGQHIEVILVSSSSSSSTSSSNRGMGSNVEQWRPLVSQYFSDVDTALCLMAHESGGNPNARNPSSGASGLMQVLPSWADNFGYSPDDLYTPEVNLEISAALYADGGWGHWSPYLRGECR